MINLDELFDGIHLVEDQEIIKKWSEEILHLKLYQEHGLAQEAFRGEWPIFSMLYIPGIAWGCWHGSQFRRLNGSVFVRPDLRRNGIGTRIRQIGVISPETWKMWDKSLSGG
jgi:GNAT superfamily N-acetyltransferase